jgi:hypothetical protein
MRTCTTSRHRRGWLPAALASLALVAAASGTAQPLAAQVAGSRVQAPGADRIERRVQRISPTSGPPGTVVTVGSALMPHLTPVRLAMGATRVGFEALAELLTSATGEFEVAVTVPEWARWDRNHRFILFDFYFNPIAASESFLVTDEQGRVRREGRIAREGSCVVIHDTDGETFALAGDEAAITALADDQRVVLTGTLPSEPSRCGERTVLRVLEMQSVPSPTKDQLEHE